jgi:hypothetical protein
LNEDNLKVSCLLSYCLYSNWLRIYINRKNINLGEIVTQLNFRKTVQPLTEEYEIKPVTEYGTIKQITVHFPDGCNSLVEVKVFHGTRQILPEKGGIALDNATPSFVIERDVSLGDPIRVEWINHDDTYPHSISVIVSIVPKLKVL